MHFAIPNILEYSLYDYIDTINLVRDFQFGMDEYDRGSKPTVRMKPVVRMVSGYLNNPPVEFAKLTRADLENYYENFNEFKKTGR